VAGGGGAGAGAGAGGSSLVDGGTVAELRQALRNVSQVLGSEGATLADVVKATVFLVDMADFASVNEIWIEAFGDARPARSTVAVAALPLGARAEVEAWAYAPVV
jgi:2-iminobutanoate/2-iminopropanoate deaminase